MILMFWTSTAVSELFAGPAVVTQVKVLIPWGFVVLVPAMMAVGISGSRLGRSRGGRLVANKSRRMTIIAANGMLVLIPSAIFLSIRAEAGGSIGRSIRSRQSN